MKNFPKLPMIYYEMRKSVPPTQLDAPLKKFIREYYQELGESYNNEIKEFENLRNEAINIYKQSHDVNGCSKLKRYYSQLFNLNNKAKILNASIDTSFTWIDNYSGQQITSDIQYELNSILYNIGALHSELGASDARTTAENIKAACTHFQCAAWAFQQLKESCKDDYANTDFDPKVVSSMHDTMLGQAQECIVEKSILDDLKASIIAKVATQVVDYYQEALVMILYSVTSNEKSHSTTHSKANKFRRTLLEYKIGFFKAVSFLFMGDYCGEIKKFGEQLSWYISGEDTLRRLNKSTKLINKDSTDLQSESNLLERLILSKKDPAQKDNDFIYHEKIPSTSELTAIKGVSLVKDIGFNVSDQDISGPDIFRKLVPIEAHQVASIYSNKKDQLLREIKKQMEEKNEDLSTFMSSIELDKNKLRPEIGKIPDDLIEICASLSVKPMIVKETQASLECLEQLSCELDKSINEADRLIEEEEQKEKKHEELYGTRGSFMILRECKAELNKLRSTHEKALVSNSNLKKALEQCSIDIEKIIKYSAEDLETIMDPLKNIHVDEEMVKELEKLLDKIDQLKTQRHYLYTKLKDEINKDDILCTVLATAGKDEDLFEREIKKFDETINLLKQNFAAQEVILLALTKANCRFANFRLECDEAQKKIKSHINSLIEAYESFMKLRDNIIKGEEIYKGFGGVVEKIIQRVKGVAKVQNEQREKFEKVCLNYSKQDSSNLIKSKMEELKINKSKQQPVYSPQFAQSNVQVYLPQMPSEPIQTFSNNVHAPHQTYSMSQQVYSSHSQTMHSQQFHQQQQPYQSQYCQSQQINPHSLRKSTLPYYQPSDQHQGIEFTSNELINQLGGNCHNQAFQNTDPAFQNQNYILDQFSQMNQTYQKLPQMGCSDQISYYDSSIINSNNQNQSSQANQYISFQQYPHNFQIGSNINPSSMNKDMASQVNSKSLHQMNPTLTGTSCNLANALVGYSQNFNENQASFVANTTNIDANTIAANQYYQYVNEISNKNTSHVPSDSLVENKASKLNKEKDSSKDILCQFDPLWD